MSRKPTLAQVQALPPDTESLLELLENSYPPKCIQPDENLSEAHRYAGAVELVEKLRIIQDRKD